MARDTELRPSYFMADRDVVRVRVTDATFPPLAAVRLSIADVHRDGPDPLVQRLDVCAEFFWFGDLSRCCRGLIMPREPPRAFRHCPLNGLAVFARYVGDDIYVRGMDSWPEPFHYTT